MAKQKVFGIGFHKTGTTSLAAALTALGYRVTGPNGVQDPDIATNLLPLVTELAEQYDAFQDNPWPLVYPQMSERYPDSKFILTVRDTDQWINSVCNHFGTQVTPMRKLIYGAGAGKPIGDKAYYRMVYENHNRDVQDFFRSQKDRLLVMNFAKGDGWEKLCGFLEVAVPNLPFPHENKGSYTQA